MTVGIVGLGLIGGSFAKAYHAAGHNVMAYDSDRSVLGFAKLEGSVDGELRAEDLSACDLILLCVYPESAAKYLEENGKYIGNVPVVIDCCGTKRHVVAAGTAAAEKYGFTYAGGHPMAGTQFSGFKHARKDMFRGAPMVIVPPRFDDIVLLDRIKRLLSPAGFSGIAITDAEDHDKIIAFTSQLAHVVSNAYIKSPTAERHTGFSAGSYKDMTRVARLNPEMWTELFLENGDNLSRELDILIKNLSDYKEAIDNRDCVKLKELLAAGSARKEEVDGK